MPAHVPVSVPARVTAATAVLTDSRALAALVAGALAMGASPIFVRLAGMGPFAGAFWRVVLALPVLWLWMRAEERSKPEGGPTNVPFGALTVAAGLAFAGDLIFWHLSILNTTVANATFFATTAPIFVALIVWLVLRQPVALATLGGLALCLAGGVALIAESLGVAPGRVTGDIYGVVTAVFFGTYIVLVKRVRDGSSGPGGAAPMGPGRLTFETTAVTAAVLLGVTLAFERQFWPATPGGFLALLALAMISHAAGQGLLSVALGRLPTVFSALVVFLEAIAAAILGWVVLGEHLSAVQLSGGVLILAGLWLARPRRAPDARAPGPAA